MKTLVERFEDKYIPEPNSGCWLWTAALFTSGYGVFRVRGKNIRAHRFAWVAQRGPIPDGMFVCHRCDIPSCVNPDHLFLGTHDDNVADKMAKGRHRCPIGAANSSTKLNYEKVTAIRADTRTYAVIAKEFGVCAGTVGEIKRREIWRHLEG